MSLIPSFFGGRRSSAFDPFSLDLWDPFADFPSLSRSETAAFANARIDWKETPEAHVFKADLPGVKKEEVKVEVEDGNLLRISGQRATEKEEKNDTWHRVERSSGQFMRTFRLPENAKVDQVKAAMDNGVLTVTVPKTQDCCDGSDEYDGRIKCTNTCWEAGKAARDKLEKKIATYQEGVILRRKEIEQSKVAIAKDEAELSKLKNEEKVLQGLVQQLKERKEQIEKAEEKERLEKEKEEKLQKAAEKESGQESIEDEEKVESGKEKHDDSTHDEVIGNLDDSLEQGVEERDSRIEHVEESPNYAAEPPAKENSEVLTDASESGSDHEKEHDTTRLENTEDVPALSSPSWLKKIQMAVKNILQAVPLFQTPMNISDAAQVRKEYDGSSSKLSKIQSRISTLTEKLKLDFGPEKEFYSLYDRCFETKQN
ncbi:17.3 kDa class I heat shock protein, partial [Bienertia sinuspersici]